MKSASFDSVTLNVVPRIYVLQIQVNMLFKAVILTARFSAEGNVLSCALCMHMSVGFDP